jgi:hypothetical protein
MSGDRAASWKVEHDVCDRRRRWENIYDDASRAELMPYRSELLQLDECGPLAGQDPYVL